MVENLKFEFLMLILAGIIFSVVSFSFCGYELYKYNNLPKHNITINCYDRQWNIINNVTCSEEIFYDDKYNGANGMAKGISTLMIFIIGMIGIILIILGIHHLFFY